jgi:hypothetical protein
MAAGNMTASTQQMEHRWGTRMELHVPAELWTADGVSTHASVRNASLSGAYLETPARVPLLSRVAIRPLAREADWLDACVVRVEDGGIALEWLDPGLHSISALLAMRRDPLSAIERGPPRDTVVRIFPDKKPLTTPLEG